MCTVVDVTLFMGGGGECRLLKVNSLVNLKQLPVDNQMGMVDQVRNSFEQCSLQSGLQQTMKVRGKYVLHGVVICPRCH